MLIAPVIVMLNDDAKKRLGELVDVVAKDADDTNLAVIAGWVIGKALELVDIETADTVSGLLPDSSERRGETDA